MLFSAVSARLLNTWKRLGSGKQTTAADHTEEPRNVNQTVLIGVARCVQQPRHWVRGACSVADLLARVVVMAPLRLMCLSGLFKKVLEDVENLDYRRRGQTVERATIFLASAVSKEAPIIWRCIN